MSNLTYYLRNKEVIRNRAKNYYENNNKKKQQRLIKSTTKNIEKQKSLIIIPNKIVFLIMV